MKSAGQPELLQQLARNQGIETSYIDATGKRRVASPETLRALLDALGIPEAGEDDGERSWQKAQWADSCFHLPPVAVLWNGQSTLRFEGQQRPSSRDLKCNIQIEDGSTRPARLKVRPLQSLRGRFSAASDDPVQVEIEPPPLPCGYHYLNIGSGKAASRCLIISAPGHAYNEREKKRWGVFVPAYALHSNSSWGAGDFRDLSELSSWIGSLGGTVISTLPVLASFLDKPFDPSPYSPASRVFWNEFYLHLPAIPEFSVSPAARKLFQSSTFTNRLDHFRKNRFVDYHQEMALKRTLLELLSKWLFSRPSDRRDQFERFLERRPELRRYAQFRAVTERQQSGWTDWPERLRSGNLASGDYSREVERYHMYVQWAAQQQIDQLGSDGRRDGVSLHLDLPLGVGRDSFDMWRERDLFVTRANGGSPPDPIFTSGQNWGFAPMNPRRIREDGYRYYLEFLRFQMRQTGLLRIDHIMGLHRLYCIPRGFPASQGAYLRYPAEELYAILCLESHRHKTVLVGENLGTVPRAVNHAMTRHQFNQMYVAQYEQRPKSSQALRPPPKQSVASVNTHDMPSFTAHWRGSDLLDRARLGLIPKDKLPAEKKARRRANLALVKFLKQKRLLDKSKNPGARDVLTGCLRFLAASQARFVLVNLEDLWCETQPQNTPGTSTERPNWRRKARFSLEQIRTSKACLKILAEVDRIRAGAAKSRAAKNSRTV